MGSDFDSIINPLNGFLTHETVPMLVDYVERHAYNYMQDRGPKVLHSYNQLAPAEMVTRIFSTNASQFFKNWF